jgi:hypothetical protein
MPQAVADRLARLGGFAKAIASVLPGFEAAGSVLRRSTSCGIYNVATGLLYPGSNGAHLYILVKEVSDAKRFLFMLHDRLWLAGLGWMFSGKAGQELNRSIIDRSVFGPERLIFEADPELAPGLAQVVREPQIHEGGSLDTQTACPDLNPAEMEKLKRLHAAEKERISLECKAARESFVSEQIEKAVARGVSRDAARQTAEAWSHGVLTPDAMLYFDDLGLVAVADVLADPARFEGETLADPIEGTDYGANCAIIKLHDDGSPWIFSFAHGGCKYELKHNFASIEARINAAREDSAGRVLCQLAPDSVLDAVELSQLCKIAAKRCGASARDLRTMLRAEVDKRGKKRAQQARERYSAENTRGADRGWRNRDPFQPAVELRRRERFTAAAVARHIKTNEEELEELRWFCTPKTGKNPTANTVGLALNSILDNVVPTQFGVLSLGADYDKHSKRNEFFLRCD